MIRSRLAPIIAVLGLAALLAGCQTPQKPAYPELTFGHLPKIRLNVATIDVTEEYKPPLRLPNVEHLSPLPPGAAMARWGQDRLEAAGTSGRARLVIERASIVEVPLPLASGVRGVFTSEQAERYDGVLEAMVEIFDAEGRSVGYARATAERRRTLPEGATLDQRERLWFEMTEGMMNDINGSLESSITRHLNEYLMR